jgi:hypothetical protein
VPAIEAVLEAKYAIKPISSKYIEIAVKERNKTIIFRGLIELFSNKRLKKDKASL